MRNPDAPEATHPAAPDLRQQPGTGMYARRDTPRAALVEDVEAKLRLLTVESQKLGHAFADRHGLHPTDFEALVHVMDAEGRGTPLTPGELSVELGLSSGATTGVIDRLERRGHVRRDRADADRRKIHLRYGERGAALAVEFFGGLRSARDAVLDEFTDAELETVRRYLVGMTRILAGHRDSVTER